MENTHESESADSITSLQIFKISFYHEYFCYFSLSHTPFMFSNGQLSLACYSMKPCFFQC